MVKQRKTYQLKGTKDKPISIPAEQFVSILENKEYDVIEIEFATIEGDFDITRSNLEKVVRPYLGRQPETIDRYIIPQELTINSVVFSGIAGFPQAEFQQLVDFRGVKFNEGHFQNSDFKCLAFLSLSEFGAANFWGTIFRDFVVFGGAIFNTIAPFMDARFEKMADFGGVVFSMGANYTGAVFREQVSFEKSQCNDVIHFDNAAFLGSLQFKNLALLLQQADFSGVRYLPDNIIQWLKEALWNCQIPDYSKFDSRSRQLRRKTPQLKKRIEPLRQYLQKVIRLVLGSLGLNEENTKNPTLFNVDPNTISECSNPQFKQYISDHLYLRDFRNTHRQLYWIWRFTCDCGRNIYLWAFWTFLIIIIFGAIYADFSSPDWLPQKFCDFLEFIDPKIDIGSNIGKPTFITYLYLSAATLTTLGFGNITPSNTTAEVFVITEVIIGYLMLGGLISIFSTKMARRS